MRQYQKTKVADYIFYNGPVITVDKNNQIFEALAVKGNKIIAVGSQEEVMSLAGEKSKKIYLAGSSLVPGFVDSHLHTAVLGANTLAIDCKYPQVKSIR